MSEDRSFDDLMARLRAGDNEAAAQVFNRFAHRLIALAQSRLDRHVRTKVDPEDVLQSVFRTFFLRCAAQQMDLSSWDSLWGMLVVITQRKCGRRVGYYHAARRDVAREVSRTPAADPSAADWDVCADEPTPSEAAILTETVEQLLDRLEGRQRQILVLSLQGFSPPEISSQLGCTERTVYRVLERVKGWLQAMGEEQV
ncbi:MAG TPA: sigma-70 family RNA polymerase sigma factor [Gemmataceae bacterium]|jgi:RNA polymerase sigma-70 factor (ECF subfamily)|nr:sigma-70 family RNA polymerase sigma factor [Gemmataceae bacterium]